MINVGIMVFIPENIQTFSVHYLKKSTAIWQTGQKEDCQLLGAPALKTNRREDKEARKGSMVSAAWPQATSL